MKCAKWNPITVMMGEGKYNRHKRLYSSWKKMINRCYNPKIQEIQPTYTGCSVALPWHNFQTFAADVLDLNPEFETNKDLQLDKDLQYYGNKVYSKDNCLVVDRKVNMLFVARGAARGDLPLGITINGRSYQAQCSDGFGGRTYNTFINIQDAVNRYWLQKGKVVDAYMERYPELAAYLWNYFMLFEEEHKTT